MNLDVTFPDDFEEVLNAVGELPEMSPPPPIELPDRGSSGSVSPPSLVATRPARDELPALSEGLIGTPLPETTPGVVIPDFITKMTEQYVKEQAGKPGFVPHCVAELVAGDPTDIATSAFSQLITTVKMLQMAIAQDKSSQAQLKIEYAKLKAALERERIAKQNLIRDHQDSSERSTVTIMDLGSQKDALAAKVKALQEQTAIYEAKIKLDAEAVKVAVAEAQKDAESKVDALTARISELEHANETLKRRLDTTVEEADSAKKARRAAESSAERRIQESEAAAKVEYDKLASVARDQTESIAGLEETNQQLKERVQSLESTGTGLETANADLRAANADLETANADLRAELKSDRDTVLQIQQLLAGKALPR